MEYRTKRTLQLTVILLLIFIAGSFFGGNEYVNFLKKEIKGNQKKIDSIEKTKAILFDEIKKDSIAIYKRDSIILVLSKEKVKLLNTVKYYKDENKKIKGTYIDSPINKRIELFTRLATEKDTVQ